MIDVIQKPEVMKGQISIFAWIYQINKINQDTQKNKPIALQSNQAVSITKGNASL